jgi:hypothetical protein
MSSLTLDQVKSAKLPATWRGTYNGNEYICTHLPDNAPDECVRISRVDGYLSPSFGPGGEALAEGWAHEDGCGCELCGGDE